MTALPTPFYEADGVTLYHGDCREILPAIGVVADLVVTDPPYAVSVSGSAHIGQPGKGSRSLDFFPSDADWNATRSMWDEALPLLLAASLPHASGYAWIGHRMFGATIDHAEAAGYATRFLVWSKACPVPPPPGAGWPSAAELCAFWYPPTGRRWAHVGDSQPPRSNVIVADSYRHGQPGKVDHPTQKPERLIAPLVLASSVPGDLVLDAFAGSGTVLVTAKREGRRAIGIEINGDYCEIAARRMSQRVLDFGSVRSPSSDGGA